MRYIALVLVILFGCQEDNSIGDRNQSKAKEGVIEAQKSISDIELLELSDRMKHHVLLTNRAELPEQVKPYYGLIIDYFKSSSLEGTIFYMDTLNIKVDADTMYVPLYSLKGFRNQYELDKENEKAMKDAKKGESYLIKTIHGNRDSDGIIEIDLKSNKVMVYRMWC